MTVLISLLIIAAVTAFLFWLTDKALTDPEQATERRWVKGVLLAAAILAAALNLFG